MQEHCPGGAANECEAFRTGPICALCLPGYQSIFGGACSACPTYGGSVVFLVFVSIAMIFLYCVMLYVVIRGGKELLEQESALSRQKSGMADEEDEQFFGFDLLGDPTLANAGAIPPPIARQTTVELSEGFLIRRPAQFMFKMKIVIGFLQIITNLGISLDVPWPAAFKSFISFFSLANIDFIQASSADCVTDVGFYQKLLVVTLAPICFTVLLTLFYLVPQYFNIHRAYQAKALTKSRSQQEIASDEQSRLSDRKMARRNFWKMLIFTLFLIYPLVCSTIFRVFVCENIYGTNYLLADFSKVCAGDEWQNYRNYAIFMIFVYPLGIPAFFFFMLWRYRRQDRLQEPGIRAELGFLYESYDTGLWWFEMADMLHKLITTSLIAFLPQNGQLPAALVVLTLYMIVILVVKPYKRKGDDRLHLFVQIELWLFVYVGYLYYQFVTVSTQTDGALSFLLISICVLLFAFFLLQVLKAIWKKYKAYRAAQQGEVKVDRGVSVSKSGKPAQLTIQRSARNLKDKKGGNITGDVKMQRNPLLVPSSSSAVATRTGSNKPEDENFTSNPLHTSPEPDFVPNPLFADQLPAALQAAVNLSPRDPKKPKRSSVMAGPGLELEDDSNISFNRVPSELARGERPQSPMPPIAATSKTPEPLTEADEKENLHEKDSPST